MNVVDSSVEDMGGSSIYLTNKLPVPKDYLCIFFETMGVVMFG